MTTYGELSSTLLELASLTGSGRLHHRLIGAHILGDKDAEIVDATTFKTPIEPTDFFLAVWDNDEIGDYTDPEDDVASIIQAIEEVGDPSHPDYPSIRFLSCDHAFLNDDSPELWIAIEIKRHNKIRWFQVWTKHDPATMAYLGDESLYNGVHAFTLSEEKGREFTDIFRSSMALSNS